MAKFGTEVTQMNAPSLGGAGFISQGVEDRSAAISTGVTTGLIANVGKAGMAAYHGSVLAEAEKQYNPIIEEGYTRSAASSIFQTGLPPEEIDVVLKGFQIDVDKYQKALNQGIMTA